MPDRIIVTVQWQNEEADFEFPSKTALSELESEFSAAVRQQFPKARPQIDNWQFYCEGKLLDPHRSLAEYGIFDGAIIAIA